jgi:putative transposase
MESHSRINGPASLLSVSHAAELLGITERAVYLKIQRGALATKTSRTASINGKTPRLVPLSSLSVDTQLRYWQGVLKQGSESAQLNLAEVPPSAREKGLMRLSLVQNAGAIMESNEQVLRRMKQLAREQRIGLGTLYRWVADYRREGMAGLIPGCGKKKGAFTALSTALQGLIKDEWLRPERPSVMAVWRNVRAFCLSTHQPCPSVRTVHRFLLTIPRPVAIALRQGDQAYQVQCQPKVHRTYKDLAVGEMWVGDHRELDLFVQEGGKVFRPWLTAWMDLRSRTIVGWHLDVIPNSYTIALALRSGILRFGLPRRLYMDNGKDFTANFWGGKKQANRAVTLNSESRAVLALLNISVTHAQVRSPWSKAIEPWFGHTLPPWERTLPGWCGRDNKERPEKLKAEIRSGHLLSLDACRATLAECIEAYHDREHSALGATPRSLWQGVSKRIPDERALDLILMKHKPARVYMQGIKLFGRHYWHDALHDHLHTMVEIRYDPADIGALVVFAKGTFVCLAIEDKAFSMQFTEREAKEMTRRRKAARERLQHYSQDHAVVMDPNKAAELVAKARSSAGCSRRSTSPRPEPGGRVRAVATGFEQAAALSSNADELSPPVLTQEPHEERATIMCEILGA